MKDSKLQQIEGKTQEKELKLERSNNKISDLEDRVAKLEDGTFSIPLFFSFFSQELTSEKHRADRASDDHHKAQERLAAYLGN